MIELIKSAIRTNNFDLIASRSFKNCHAKGLWSFVLHKEPTVRVFFADFGHELYQDFAVHPHHCDITIVPIAGNLKNINYKERGRNYPLFEKYKYQSGIKENS
jgi:hypothetical protein